MKKFKKSFKKGFKKTRKYGSPIKKIFASRGGIRL